MIRRHALFAALCFVLNLYGVQCRPDNTEIFWDIHHVIIKVSTKEILKTLYNAPNKTLIFSSLFNRKLLKDLKNLSKTGSSGGIYAERLKQEDSRLSDFMINLANSQSIIKGMEKLILKLAKQGYTMYVASNIGNEVYQKLKQKYPHIFNDKVIKDGKTVDFSQKNPVEKPNLQFFKELNSLRDAHKEHALFIDDKRENVEASEQEGFIGIQFNNAKQLRKELKKLTQ